MMYLKLFLLCALPLYGDIQKNTIISNTVTTANGYDISRLFNSPEALKTAVDIIDTRYKDLKMTGYIAFTLHGFAFATALAHTKSVKVIYFDKTFTCAKDEKFIIITDILTSSEPIQTIISTVKSKGGNVIEVSCVTECGKARSDIEVPVASIFINAPK